MSEIKLHVTDVDGFLASAREAVRRIDRGDLGEQESVVAFENAEMLLGVLTANRWRLLRSLRAAGPISIRRLAGLLGRDYRGVHADVAMLREVGLIDRTDDGKILVPWSRITAEMNVEDVAA